MFFEWGWIRKGPALFFMLFAGSSCSSPLYYPSFERLDSPERFGLSSERVQLEPSPGVAIFGDYISAPKATAPKPTQGIFVFFHGNGENRTSHFAALHWLPSEGYDYFIFDYQGYGDSTGEPTPEGTVRDGIAALRWAHARARAHKPPLPLIVFGQSLGGAVAARALIELKGEIPVTLLVLDSTFLSYRAAMRSVMSQRWFTWWLQPLSLLLASDTWAPKERIRELQGVPTVVIHGQRDAVIDYSLGRELFEQAAEPKEFWSIPTGEHIDAFWRHDGIYRKRLLEKLAVLKPAAP